MNLKVEHIECNKIMILESNMNNMKSLFYCPECGLQVEFKEVKN